MKGLGHRIKDFAYLYFKEYERQLELGKLTFNNNDYDSDERFVFYLLDKIVETFSATAELFILSEQENLSYLRNSNYVLLRSCLYDCIIILWIFSPSNKDKLCVNSIRERITISRKDHLKYHLAYLRRMQSLGLLTTKERNSEINILNKHYSHLINKDIDSNLEYKTEKSFSVLEILSESNKSNPILVEAYKIYNLYSKIEHTGEFTRMILETTYKGVQNPMDDFLINSVNIIHKVIKLITPLYLKDETFKANFEEFVIIDKEMLGDNS